MGLGRWVWPVLALGVTGFIFFHSSQPADVSNLYSGSVLQLIREILQALQLPDAFCTNHGIRKAAHFSEFFFQAAVLSAAMLWFDVRRRVFLGYVLFFGLLTAVLDENLQVFVPGRAGMVQDVLLDFAGSLSGAAVALAVAAFYRRFCGTSWQLKPRRRWR